MELVCDSKCMTRSRTAFGRPPMEMASFRWKWKTFWIFVWTKLKARYITLLPANILRQASQTLLPYNNIPDTKHYLWIRLFVYLKQTYLIIKLRRWQDIVPKRLNSSKVLSRWFNNFASTINVQISPYFTRPFFSQDAVLSLILM